MRAFRTVLLALAAAGALSACSPPASNAPAETVAPPTTEATPSVTLPEQPGFVWQSAGAAQVLSDKPPARITLGADQVFLYYPSTAVTAGQTVQFDFTASSAGGGSLRTVLMRHCGQGSDADSASEVFTLSAQPQNFSVKHKFSQAHECIRVMFASPEASTGEVTVDTWKLTPTLAQ